MNAILMLIVRLMLAAADQWKTMVETMTFPQPPRDPLRVPVTVLRGRRYALALDD